MIRGEQRYKKSAGFMTIPPSKCKKGCPMFPGIVNYLRKYSPMTADRQTPKEANISDTGHGIAYTKNFTPKLRT